MLGRCGNCEDRWKLFLAEESKINNMSNSEKPKEVKETQSEVPAATPQAQVAKTQRVDVNKVIEDRRKAAQGGKTINK